MHTKVDPLNPVYKPNPLDILSNAIITHFSLFEPKSSLFRPHTLKDLLQKSSNQASLLLLLLRILSASAESLHWLSDVVPSKQVVLDPQNLIQCQNHRLLAWIRHIIHIHDRAHNNTNNVTKKHTHMDILHPKVWAGLAMLEAWLAGVHYADIVEVLPEWGSRRQIGSGDELDEVVLEEVLAH